MVTKVWDDPEIFDIQIELSNSPLRSLNVYIITTPQQNLIIDTGFNNSDCRTALWHGIRQLGLDLGKTSVFLTHLHSDHIGLAGDFVLRNCPIYMGRIEYQYLNEIMNDADMLTPDKLYQAEGFPVEILVKQMRENQGYRYGIKQMFPARLIDDNLIISLGNLKVQCILTPGHTPGHMVLYLPEQQILFTGDHILFDITPNITVWPKVSSSLSDYIASLRSIKELSVKAAFPAHREAGANVYRRIDELIDHHRQRLNEIYLTVRSNPGSTAYQLAGLIHWSMRGLSWEEFPPSQRWFAMGETLAHLFYLAEKKQLIRRKENVLVRYYPRLG